MRHAEKDLAGDPRDPGLSPAGKARAEALARLLARAGATHLFASEFKRTQETLAPLAAQAGLQVEVVPAAKAKELAERLRAQPRGSVSVVAGHSNTIPGLIAALGGEVKGLESTPQGPMLSEKDFGRMFVVTLALPPNGAPSEKPHASVVELAYDGGGN